MTTKNTNDLSSRAMLARLTVTQWSARKVDKRASAETIDREQASADAGRFNKQLLAGTDAALKEISRISTAARSDHYRLTLPWTDDGARILTAAGYMEYTATMAGHASAFEQAVDSFMIDYPRARDQARFALGQMYSEDDYPNDAKARSKFSFSTSADPLPTSADFRVNLSDDAVNAIRADLAHRMKQAEVNAMRDVWQRLFSAVNHMAQQLPKYSAGDIKRFNDTLVDNVRDICDLLPALNLSDDQNLNDLAAQVRQQLCCVGAQTLRDNDNARENTASAAAALTRKMAAFMGQPVPEMPAPARSVEAQILGLFAPRAA